MCVIITVDICVIVIVDMCLHIMVGMSRSSFSIHAVIITMTIIVSLMLHRPANFTSHELLCHMGLWYHTAFDISRLSVGIVPIGPSEYCRRSFAQFTDENSD